MKPPLIIDTSALRDAGFWKWLRNYHGRKVLPAVAYAELSVYLVNIKHRTQDQVDELLGSMDMEIGWYRADEARRTVEIAGMTRDFTEKARDHMIASHAFLPPWVVVTYNIKDFKFLNDRAMTPPDAQIRFG
jgi:predicted nucleic acid-binding protein